MEQKARLIAYKGDCYRLEGLFQVSYACVLSLPNTAEAHYGLLRRVMSRQKGETQSQSKTLSIP